MDVNVAGLYQLDGLCQVSSGQAAVGINADFNPSVTPLLHQLLKLLGSQVADGPRTLCMGKMKHYLLISGRTAGRHGQNHGRSAYDCRRLF